MKPGRSVNKSLFFILLSSISSVLLSQSQIKTPVFIPYVGQPGKDVIWVPTPPELVDKMLDLADVSEKDFLIDLGSGDGRTVIAAAKLGAKALGIEFNPDMVELSKKKAEEAGVSNKTNFVVADLFGYDLSEATVITMFLLPDINLRLRPHLLALRPGTRIVSNTFTMGEWQPDLEEMAEGNWDTWFTALMWIIPAKVEGVWNIGSGILTLYQEFQMVYGTLKTSEMISNITEGRLKGDEINFSVNGATYTGRVTGKNSMSGTLISNTGKSTWHATR